MTDLEHATHAAHTAGQLLVEAAGGKVVLTEVQGHGDSWSIVASNGKLPIDEIL